MEGMARAEEVGGAALEAAMCRLGGKLEHEMPPEDLGRLACISRRCNWEFAGRAERQRVWKRGRPEGTLRLTAAMEQVEEDEEAEYFDEDGIGWVGVFEVDEERTGMGLNEEDDILGSQEIQTLVGTSPSVEALHVEACLDEEDEVPPLTSEGFIALGNAIRACPGNIRELSIIGMASLDLHDHLTRPLVRLDLTAASLMDGHMEVIANALSENLLRWSLVRLVLAENGITERGLERLARGVRESRGLEELDIERVAANETHPLISGLKGPPLRKLNLRRTATSTRACRALAGVMKSSLLLKWIDLTGINFPSLASIEACFCGAARAHLRHHRHRAPEVLIDRTTSKSNAKRINLCGNLKPPLFSQAKHVPLVTRGPNSSIPLLACQRACAHGEGRHDLAGEDCRSQPLVLRNRRRSSHEGGSFGPPLSPKGLSNARNSC